MRSGSICGGRWHRFRATAGAKRFKCKLGGKRFRPCRSPKHYRGHGGKQVFCVYAIAPTGQRGPTTRFHFRVGKLTIPTSPGSGGSPGQKHPVRVPGLPPGEPCVPNDA